MKEIAIITGATEGMGLEFAKILAQKNYDLILTARNDKKLSKIKTDFESNYKINVYTFAKDLSQPQAAKELYADISKLNLNITTLINNAGLGDYGYFCDTDLDKEMQMIQLNVSSLVTLTKYCLIEMKKNNYGRIMNVASLLSFFPMPMFNVYAATKAFVLSFSEALNNELNGTKITVTTLCPGPTKTKFTTDSEMGNSRAYKFTTQATPEDVAKFGIKAMLKGKRTTIFGFGNNLLAFSTRMGTRGLVLKIARFIAEK